jgi:HK97 family phage major capsid protein
MNPIEIRQKRAAVLKEASAILTLAQTEKRENTADEITAWEAKHAEAKRLLESAERMESQIKLDAENAVHVGGAAHTPASVTPAGANAKRAKGQGFTDCVRAIGVAGRDRHRAADFAENTLHNPEVARALSASSATGGGFAVPTALAEEFIEFLRPASVVRAAQARSLPMPNGNLTLPKITGGAVATYIGENQTAPATQQTVGAVKLTAKKLAAVVPISNDLIRYANPNTDAVIREDLVKAVAQAEDSAFLRGIGTAYTPKGLRYWAPASNLVTSNHADTASSTAIFQVTLELGQLITALLNANVPVTLETGHFFFSPRTMMFLKTLRNPTTGMYAFPEMQGAEPRLLGYRVSHSTQIPINLTSTATGGSQITTGSEYYFADMSEVIIGEAANLVLDVSAEASYVDSGSNVVSAFANDQTVIRVIEEHDFGVRYPQAVAVATAVEF